jgi:transmembrane sensor
VTTDNEHRDSYWEDLFEYFDRECSPVRAAAIERWIQSDPEIARRVELERASWEKLKRAASPMGRANTLASLRRLQGRREVFELTGVDPGAGAESVAAHRDRRASQHGLALQVTRLAAAALIVAGGALGIRQILASGGGWGRLRTAEYSAARGERVHITLPDGTSAMLAPESKLTYAAQERGGPRIVKLLGRAYFEVVHDANRPFSVHTGATETDDVGTHFLVEAYPGEARVRVAVAEGEVAVRADSVTAAHPLQLSAGETAVIQNGIIIAKTRDSDASDYSAWGQGSYRMRDASLVEVAHEMSRWYDLDVRVGDSALATQRLSITIGSESPDELLLTIAKATHAHVMRRSRAVVLYRP